MVAKLERASMILCLCLIPLQRPQDFFVAASGSVPGGCCWQLDASGWHLHWQQDWAPEGHSGDGFCRSSCGAAEAQERWNGSTSHCPASCTRSGASCHTSFKGILQKSVTWLWDSGLFTTIQTLLALRTACCSLWGQIFFAVICSLKT